MSCIEFISQIKNNKKQPVWFKPETVVEKEEIYTAYEKFCKDNKTKIFPKQLFWPEVNYLICDPNCTPKRTRSEISKKQVYCITFFSKDAIINNLNKILNNKDTRLLKNKNKKRKATESLEKHNRVPKQKKLKISHHTYKKPAVYDEFDDDPQGDENNNENENETDYEENEDINKLDIEESSNKKEKLSFSPHQNNNFTKVIDNSKHMLNDSLLGAEENDFDDNDVDKKGMINTNNSNASINHSLNTSILENEIQHLSKQLSSNNDFVKYKTTLKNIKELVKSIKNSDSIENWSINQEKNITNEYRGDAVMQDGENEESNDNNEYNDEHDNGLTNTDNQHISIEAQGAAQRAKKKERNMLKVADIVIQNGKNDEKTGVIYLQNSVAESMGTFTSTTNKEKSWKILFLDRKNAEIFYIILKDDKEILFPVKTLNYLLGLGDLE
jgi:hypothetical protein